ncbi:hypothetical protein OBV_43700 [Oscillibacter valericigenes Sjm18-20]|nr:hypothetical protein OBV_43700 [Oscillibacter valericigenes Sjm18-20]
MIGDSVEVIVQAHRFDGLVFLASCDKIVPSMARAAEYNSNISLENRPEEFFASKSRLSRILKTLRDCGKILRRHVLHPNIKRRINCIPGEFIKSSE